jgi:hypothetical protein
MVLSSQPTMSTVSIHYQSPKRNDTDNQVEQGWSGYHEELSTDPTFTYGLIVSHDLYIQILPMRY